MRRRVKSILHRFVNSFCIGIDAGTSSSNSRGRHGASPPPPPPNDEQENLMVKPHHYDDDQQLRDQRKLAEADKDRVSATTRFRQEIEQLEEQVGDLEQQLQLQQQQQQKQPVTSGPLNGQQDDDCMVVDEEGGAIVDNQADGAGLSSDWAAASKPPPSRPPIRRAAAVPLPPVLHLDPAQLLVEADLDVGLTRADIQTELHQFASAVSWLCRQGKVQDVARDLAVFSMDAAIPEGSVVALPSMDDMVAAERPACLAHLLMFWMSNNVWVDPLRYLLGCNSLGLLETLLPAGGAAERNFDTLLRSHAARQWLHTLRGVFQEAAFDAESKGDLQGWHARLVSRNVQQQDRATSAAISGLKAMTEELAGWLHSSFPIVAIAVRTDLLFHLLLLRALKLGLTVLAAHPLLRLYVTMPPAVQQQGDRRFRPKPLDCTAQDAQRCRQFVPNQDSEDDMKHTAGDGRFVLCSLQPGVRYAYDGIEGAVLMTTTGIAVSVQQGLGAATTATAGAARPYYPAAAAAAGHPASSSSVLIKEEVVVWMWEVSHHVSRQMPNDDVSATIFAAAT
ncbi:hypothetical protein Vafri_5797 [Volvox africanus]|nr:hypothetical protein Vafri_5797 [Volvox africanus]